MDASDTNKIEISETETETNDGQNNGQETCVL